MRSSLISFAFEHSTDPNPNLCFGPDDTASCRSARSLTAKTRQRPDPTSGSGRFKSPMLEGGMEAVNTKAMLLPNLMTLSGSPFDDLAPGGDVLRGRPRYGPNAKLPAYAVMRGLTVGQCPA